MNHAEQSKTVVSGPDAGLEAGHEAACTIVYDGECAFCQRQVARIRALDPNGSFEYVRKQAADLMEKLPALRDSNFETGMRIVLPDGQVRVGADSVYEIARRLPGWRWLAWIYRVPLVHQAARGVYAWIARNRKRL